MSPCPTPGYAIRSSSEVAPTAGLPVSLRHNRHASLLQGDNFYPCGADSQDSGLDRFQTDWNDVYHLEEVPNIAGLTWYQTLGNHDYVFQNSVGRQVNYSATDDRYPSQTTLSLIHDVLTFLILLNFARGLFFDLSNSHMHEQEPGRCPCSALVISCCEAMLRHCTDNDANVL